MRRHQFHAWCSSRGGNQELALHAEPLVCPLFCLGAITEQAQMFAVYAFRELVRRARQANVMEYEMQIE